MSGPQRIVVRIKKNADGRASLSCTRADGTTTWQRLEGSQAAFFPRHDLTHYAVETVLGHKRGFFGLVSEGWDLADFGARDGRRKIPPESVLSEMTVGLLDLERATGQLVQPEDINERLMEFCGQNGLPKPPEITEDDLGKVRKRRSELFKLWEAVKPGDALELPFDVAASP
jgi:hypothetical protein